MKSCRGCSVEKPKEVFYKNRSLCSECLAARKCKRCCDPMDIDIAAHGKFCSKECNDLFHKNKIKNRPNRRREESLKRNYKMTLNDLEQMLEDQAYRCKICDNELMTPYVDHDHSCCSGVITCGKCIRGLLCSSCNRGLGDFRDDPAIIEKAARYLKRELG